MNNKMGTELEIALDTPDELRDKSVDLNVGFNRELNTWTLQVKYTGNLKTIGDKYQAVVIELLGGYGIIEIKPDLINELSREPNIVFIEKPKSFIQGRTSINGFSASCMRIPYFPKNLRGRGIAVAVIDSGIDINHPDFFDEENGYKNSRIIGIWDQSIAGNPPNNYNVGSNFWGDDIDNALNADVKNFPSVDVSGHGTAVAGIVTACTPEAALLIVKLKSEVKSEEISTINLILGIDYAVRHSVNNNIPMVINLSYGNNYGDHNGNSFLEEYIDTVSKMSKLTFVVGAGNDGVAGRHAELILGNDSWYKRDFQVFKGEKGINIQIWKEFVDLVDIFIITPSGEEIGPFNNYEAIMNFELDGMSIKVINSEATPFNIMQETYISILPLEDYIEDGIWGIRFNPKKIISGRINIWLPVLGSTVTEVSFLNPSEYITMTIPSTSASVITVGAYNSNTLSYAEFSGRGYTVNGLIKPDIVAPGVDIDVPLVGGGYGYVSGTSFATPFVASASAMLMQYGIINNNDLFLFGEKVKAYLISGAKQLPSGGELPNRLIGWGTLCVENSLP